MDIATVVCFAIGTVLIVGGARDWEFLTDPPKEMFWCYSQSLLRLVFSRRAMRLVTAILGCCFLLAPVSWSWPAQ